MDAHLHRHLWDNHSLDLGCGFYNHEKEISVVSEGSQTIIDWWF